MEDGRIWPPLFLLILIVGGMYCFRYLEQVDASNSALLDMQLVLNQSRESLEDRKKMWVTVDAAEQKLAHAQQQHKATALIQEDADKKERLVQGDLKYAVTSFRAAVEKVRLDAVGVEIPEIVLLNGTTLKQAKIRKFDDDAVSIFHSEGISNVPFEQLPKDLAAKFDTGPDSLLLRLEKLESSIGKPVAKVIDHSEVERELTAIGNKIASLDIQVSSTTKHKDKLEAEVLQYEKQIKEAEEKGTFTFHMRTMRDVAEGNAGTARNDLKKLQLELERLRATESSLRLRK